MKKEERRKTEREEKKRGIWEGKERECISVMSKLLTIYISMALLTFCVFLVNILMLITILKIRHSTIVFDA